jgi:hypothetical protein
MKAYFTASVLGGERYLGNYVRIVKVLEELGLEVYEQTTKVSKNYVHKEISDENKVKYYKQVLRWMNQADVIVVEASYSSLSIGHEITVALDKGKPVIVLYSESDAPHFLIGVQSDKLIVQKYKLGDLKRVLKDCLDYATEQRDTRFNFFVPRRLSSYLDWVAKKNRISRAVYLRQLIKSEMKKDKVY